MFGIRNVGFHVHTVWLASSRSEYWQILLFVARWPMTNKVDQIDPRPKASISVIEISLFTSGFRNKQDQLPAESDYSNWWFYWLMHARHLNTKRVHTGTVWSVLHFKFSFHFTKKILHTTFRRENHGQQKSAKWEIVNYHTVRKHTENTKMSMTRLSFKSSNISTFFLGTFFLCFFKLVTLFLSFLVLLFSTHCTMFYATSGISLNIYSVFILRQFVTALAID